MNCREIHEQRQKIARVCRLGETPSTNSSSFLRVDEIPHRARSCLLATSLARSLNNGVHREIYKSAFGQIFHGNVAENARADAYEHVANYKRHGTNSF